MRETDLRLRLTNQLGRAQALAWADTVVLAELGQRTVNQALAAGLPCKTIWRAAWASLELTQLER